MNPKDFLKQTLLEKKTKNPSYSLTAFARDLEIPQPHLSKILNGQRRLTPEKAYQIGKRLNLSEKQFSQFIVSTVALGL